MSHHLRVVQPENAVLSAECHADVICGPMEMYLKQVVYNSCNRPCLDDMEFVLAALLQAARARIHEALEAAMRGEVRDDA